MDTQLTTIYVLCDELLQTMGHHEDKQRSMSDAEVMTTALAAARFFRGNFAAAALLLKSHRYIPKMLSKSQLSRRLHKLVEPFVALFQVLGELWKNTAEEDHQAPQGCFLLDSFPVSVCDNIRIRRCRLYPVEETEGAYRGYIASKRRYFYGLKIHLLTNETGLPVEVFFTPGSYSDTAQLKNYAFDLPAGSVVYGDKAYNEYLTEDLLKEGADVELLPLRKKDSKRSVEAFVEYVQHYYRKAVETAASQIERLLPKSIHAVTPEGFELKVFLFVLAHSLGGLL